MPAAIALSAADMRKRGSTSCSNAARKIWSKCARLMRKSGVTAELAPFFDDLPQRMAKAHLVIGRSGAGTVAELMVIGRPAILVPLPHALDDNQTPNADALADAGGGWRVAQRELTPQKLCRDAAVGIFADAGRSGEARGSAPMRRRSPTRPCSSPISSTGSGGA